MRAAHKRKNSILETLTFTTDCHESRGILRLYVYDISLALWHCASTSYIPTYFEFESARRTRKCMKVEQSFLFKVSRISRIDFRCPHTLWFHCVNIYIAFIELLLVTPNTAFVIVFQFRMITYSFMLLIIFFHHSYDNISMIYILF